MKRIELSDKTYADLLELKNQMSMKVRDITNSEVLSVADIITTQRISDWEPEYKFDEFISDITEAIWYEQETGEVAYIT